MANKYIRHGETYNGDGTTSDAAASNGAAGAWNTITYLEGTTPAYGSIAAGDVIYIRSKDAAGADITRTLAADVNLGSSAATSTSSINWILDNGTVWSGIDGVLKYTNGGVTSNNAILLSYNRFEAMTQSAWVFESTATSTVADLTYVVELSPGARLVGAKIDYSTHTSTIRFAAVLCANGVVIENAKVRAGVLPTSNNVQGCAMFSTYQKRGRAILINPDIELTTTNIGGVGLFFLPAIYGFDWLVIGGRVHGAGAITGQPIMSHDNNIAILGNIRSVGFDIPRDMTIVVRGGLSAIDGAQATVEILGCDGGIGGYIESYWGFATSRTDNNPPTLNATLPDAGSTPWAWRVYPANATLLTPMQLVATKLFVDTAATKTITQEVLIANTLSLTKKTLYITVVYTDDSTGLPKSISSYDVSGGALDSSTAGWSSSTWGMVTLTKNKMTVTTPTSVKSGSLILVTVWCTAKSATASDILFIDPDFVIT